MIPDDLLPHLVDIEHPGQTTDRYGDTITDWTPGATAHAPVQGWLQQNTGAEDTAQRDAQIGEWLLLCNPVTTEGDALTVHGSDRVNWNGAVFEVIGPAGPAYEPSQLHHYEIRLKTVEG